MLLAWLLPLLFIASPGELFMIVSAILWHEGGHLFGFLLLGRPLPSLRAIPRGLLLSPKSPLPYRSELLVALLGPLFNLSAALLLLRFFPGSQAMLSFALIHLVFGVSNLLPLPGNDGARALFDLSALLFPLRVAEVVSGGIVSLLTVLLLFSLFFLLLGGGGALAAFLLFSLLLRVFPEGTKSKL